MTAFSSGTVASSGDKMRGRTTNTIKTDGKKRYSSDKPISEEVIASVRTVLLQWFEGNQRTLPWRNGYHPYEVWISEIMLQQTQVKTMLPYFHRWMKRFPTVRDVAEAREEEILKLWEGLGYYSRAKNIHRAAAEIMKTHGGTFPENYADILALPGIGRYTAGAVSSIAFNRDRPVVDGNVERIFARFFNLDTPVKDGDNPAFIWRMAGEMIPEGHARPFNQALMELGATICLPRKPACGKCPVSSWCASHRLGITKERPVARKRKGIVPVEVAVGVLFHEGKVLIQKRLPSGLMPGLWEFPGGKILPGESPEAALEREFYEELELRVRCRESLTLIRHSYTSFKVALHAFSCEPAFPGQAFVLHSAVEARWVEPGEFKDYAFPAANRKLIRTILQE